MHCDMKCAEFLLSAHSWRVSMNELSLRFCSCLEGKLPSPFPETVVAVNQFVVCVWPVSVSVQAYMEGTLSEWTAAALVLIQRTLEASADGITRVSSTTSGGSSTSRRRSRSSHPRRSLASALTSRDCSPTHRNGTWRRVGSDGSSVAEHARGQSVLRRVLSLGRRDRHAHEFAQGGSGDGDDGQSEGGQQQVENSQGQEDATEEGDATTAHNCVKNGGDKPAAFRTSIEGTLDGSNRDPAGPPSPVPPGPEEEEAGLARADLADLLRDAQEGMEAGIGAGQEGDIIGALLRTSEELVATVKTQQKASKTGLMSAN